jgi:hypothetical protein
MLGGDAGAALGAGPSKGFGRWRRQVVTVPERGANPTTRRDEEFDGA